MAESIRLKPSEPDDYERLLSWVEDNEAYIQWAGPFVAFPSCAAELQMLLQTNNYRSFSLWQDAPKGSVLLGFGQIQIWSTRAHLGRLVVAPQHRNKGLSYILINQLIGEAARQQQIDSVSLFVYDNNYAAIKSYENLGFVPAAYPEGIARIAQCTFMTRCY